MEILDKVYKTFVNLDRDFARSKKSRTEFITGKFGGDIAIGSMIILDAVSADADSNSPEDVRKLTFIKKMISQIRSAGTGLDSLEAFRSLESSSEMDSFLNILDKAMYQGTGVRAMSQSALVKETKEAVHLRVRMDGSLFCPMADSKVLYPFNGNMLNYMLTTYRFERSADMCQYYEVLHNQAARQITPNAVMKIL